MLIIIFRIKDVLIVMDFGLIKFGKLKCKYSKVIIQYYHYVIRLYNHVLFYSFSFWFLLAYLLDIKRMRW
jgi:hypothetical protein